MHPSLVPFASMVPLLTFSHRPTRLPPIPGMAPTPSQGSPVPRNPLSSIPATPHTGTAPSPGIDTPTNKPDSHSHRAPSTAAAMQAPVAAKQEPMEAKEEELVTPPTRKGLKPAAVRALM